ncbi:MAG: endonuclease domain-containing protein [Rhizomicrobium sp.]
MKAGTIDRARRLRGNRADTEGLLWWKLRELNARGYHFRRQAPMRGYFLDFVEHSGRVAIELDGSQHGFRQNIQHDRKRDDAIAAEGYLVLRFWNDEVRENLDGIVEAIVREIGKRRPPPEALRASTSPQGGGDSPR